MRLRLVLCALAIAATVVSSPLAASGDLAARLGKTLRSPHLSLARTSAIAVDVKTGAVLFAHNEHLPVIPASNEKLPVSWAALTRLGPGYRFVTEVLGVGSRAGATWDGDLYLRGSGDPSLTPTDVGRLAASVRAAGIRRVTGRIRGDESLFDMRRGVAGWKPYFVGGETPPLSALVVDRARGWPALSPPLLAARALHDALVAHGVTVDGAPGLGKAPAAAERIAADHSVRLSTIVRAMNRDSDNFTAEMLLKHLGTVDGHVGTSARGARLVLEAESRPDPGGRYQDRGRLGSLLARSHDRPDARRRHSRRAGEPAHREAFVGSLAVAGRNGTLHSRLPALAGLVRGKTGTTSRACSLSGLVNGSVAFAVLQDGAPVAFWPARAAQDRFVTALARSAYGRATAAPAG